jgi:hypothetical protein
MGGVIHVQGVYTDPEDGLDLNDELKRFMDDKGLQIVNNKFSAEYDAEGRPVLLLELSVDYSGLRK